MQGQAKPEVDSTLSGDVVHSTDLRERVGGVIYSLNNSGGSRNPDCPAGEMSDAIGGDGIIDRVNPTGHSHPVAAESSGSRIGIGCHRDADRGSSGAGELNVCTLT